VANLNVNSVQQTIPGFTLFPNLDPVIIGEVNLSPTTNITSSDTNKMNQELTSPQPTVPWVPAGLSVVPAGPDPMLSVPTNVAIFPGGIENVPVNIDTARPPGSSGMVEAALALSYDPKLFDVSPDDVQLGSVPLSGNGWELHAQISSQLGLIGVVLDSDVPIQTTAGGSLVVISMHERSELSVIAANGLGAPLTIMPFVDPAGDSRVYQTSVADAQGEFVLHVAQVPGGTEASEPDVIIAALPKSPNSSFVTAQTAAGVSDSGGGVSDGQQVSAGSGALSLPVVERVFGDSRQISQALQNSAMMEPAAILAWIATGEASDCSVSDLAFLQTPNGINQAAEWLPNYGLAPVGQAARQGQPGMVTGLVDEEALGSDNGDLASFEAALARAAKERKQLL
jgi:hypothetical protein